LPLSRGDGPDADSHSETTNISSFIETDFDKATVSSKNISKLVHGGAPTEAIIDVI
jgi:hypothetical protein